jgi:diguanylate cyclase (GGDEF)-like protein
VGRVVPYHTVNIMMVENGLARVVRSHADPLSGDYGQIISGVETVEDTLYLKQMAETGMPISFPDTSCVEGWNKPWARSYAGAPIMVKGRLVGFINVTSRDINFYHTGLAYRLQAFANQSAVAIENANLYAEVQRLATLDELTSILNRRRLFELGRLELDRSRRYKMPLSVILLDLDHFKKVNDTFGHPTGDRVLAGLASAISRNIREVDLFGRYGGEEFVILLPQSSLASAQEAAERLREMVAGLQFQTNQGILRVTISLGIAELTDHVQTLAALIDRSDQAMYAAKLAGRNRVEVYEAPAFANPHV